MTKRIKIAEILRTTLNATIQVKGWVKAFRNNQFLALNDRLSSADLQVVVDFEDADPAPSITSIQGAPSCRRPVDEVAGQRTKWN